MRRWSNAFFRQVDEQYLAFRPMADWMNCRSQCPHVVMRPTVAAGPSTGTPAADARNCP
ncbi:hypothetical protein [Streptomyces cinereoruber]|uniref:hypothetical protein n=1 Tax=Streptomyces cinereoruber TaxID=67260 RepID=UPI0036255361